VDGADHFHGLGIDEDGMRPATLDGASVERNQERLLDRTEANTLFHEGNCIAWRGKRGCCRRETGFGLVIGLTKLLQQSGHRTSGRCGRIQSLGQ
jgi:hypothetical protein